MSCYDEEMAGAINRLSFLLTNDDDEGALDRIREELEASNDMEGETPLTWIAVSLERIADALDRLAPKEKAPDREG